MPVITISRQYGAGGITLGERLAKRLGYRLVSQDMIKEVAAKANVSPDGIYAFERSAGTKLSRLVGKMISGDFIDRLLGDETSYLDEKRYVGLVTDIINQLYEEGNVVFIGRGGQYILRELKKAWHILLVADPKYRQEFIRQKYNLSPAQAERVMTKGNQHREQFLRCFVADSPDNPCTYHLTINTAWVSLDRAEEMVLKLMSV